MLGFLKRLLGGPAPTTVAKPRLSQPAMPVDFALPDFQVPTQAADDVHSFVRRESMLNRNEQIAGYEFSLVTRAEADANTPADLLQQALDACGIDDRDLVPLAAQALAWSSEIQGGAPVNPQ